VVLGAVAGIAVFSRLEQSPHTLCQEVLGHACDRRYAPPVADTPRHFILFDLPDFVRRMDATPDYSRPDYFWNRFAKSSLFGVAPLGEDFQAARYSALAAVLKVLLLAMVTVCLCGAIFLRGNAGVDVGTDPIVAGLVTHLAFDGDYSDSSGRGNNASAGIRDRSSKDSVCRSKTAGGSGRPRFRC